MPSKFNNNNRLSLHAEFRVGKVGYKVEGTKGKDGNKLTAPGERRDD